MSTPTPSKTPRRMPHAVAETSAAFGPPRNKMSAGTEREASISALTS